MLRNYLAGSPGRMNVLASVLLSMFYIPVSAQTDSAGKSLEAVFVTAQRIMQKEYEIPYAVTNVQRQYLDDLNPRTVPEALQGITGVFVQKTNHGGGSPFLRGLTGNQTLILVDGIRLNNSTFRYGPNQYMNTIDPFSIKKIEVAKGTGSVQYGSDAIGGVIQVFTREPSFSDVKPSWTGKAFGKFMSGDMEKTVRGEAGYHAKRFATTIGATYRNFGDLIGGDTTGRQSPSGYKELAFDVKSKFLLNPGVELTLANQFLKQQHVPVYHKVILENFALNEFDPQQRMLNYAKLNIKNAIPVIDRIEVIASWQQNIEGRNSRKNGSNVVRKEKDRVSTLGFTTDVFSRFSEMWSANSGIELYLDKVNSSRQDVNTVTNVRSTSRGLYPDDSRYSNSSLYSLHHFRLNKWIAEGGIRYNFFTVSISDTTLGKVKITPSSFVYNASILYKLAQQQNVYVTFNTGYRAPNIDDMGTLGIVDFRYEVPSRGLAPEKSRSIEVGYKLHAAKWAAGISYYYMHLNNLITRVKEEGQVISEYPVYRKENVEEGYIRGMEAETEYQIVNGWNIKGNISWNYGQSLSKNEPLRRIPPVNGRVLSNYYFNKWFGCAELLFASKQDRLAQGDKDDNRIPRGGTPGWNVVNLYAGYQLAHLKFNVAFQNILDEDYRTHGSGINGIGRSAWVCVALKL